ncbi:MAG: substrate-binding domain-containing protein [Clostridiaceae bacterium]
MSPKKIYLLVEPSFMIPVWYSKSIDGLKRRASHQKKLVLHINSADEIEESDVRAVAIVGTSDDWTRGVIKQLHERHIRPILIGTVPNKFGEDVSGTRYSSKESIEAMMVYFCHYNRRRMALVGINGNASNDMDKRDAFLTTAQAMDLPVSQNDVFFKEPLSYNMTERFLDHMDRYDGVICSNDYMAAYIMDYASRNGVRVPEDLFVAGLGDIMLCQYTTPTLTSATRFYFETGEQVYDIWEQLNENSNITSIVTTVQCRIIVRGSTGFSPLPELPVSFRTELDDPCAKESEALAATRAIRALENCLSQCNKLDMDIVRGLLNNVNLEALAEQLYISGGTVRYRLKKIYASANVSTKSEFVELFRHYIHDDAIFERFSQEF